MLLKTHTKKLMKSKLCFLLHSPGLQLHSSRAVFGEGIHPTAEQNPDSAEEAAE